ncbi:MAG TPA: hypothetical protein VGS07_17535 [Thermoanaerobaculia bacterium]|jgi:hypothetical protein|nr:hypothetical protein [Thermoanaerobaculia bacterium]
MTRKLFLVLLLALLAGAPQSFARSGGGDDGGGDGGNGGHGGGDQSLTLRVNPAIGAPGGVVAVVLRTYAPRPIRQGHVTIRTVRRPAPAKALGLTLEALTQPIRPFVSLLSAVVYSVQGDSTSQALLTGLADSQVTQVNFQSPSGSVNAADGPLAVFFYRLNPSVRPGDTFDLTIDPIPTSLTDSAGQPITLAPRSSVLTVRAASAAYKVEADGDKVQPGEVAELGVNTFEPFAMGSGRVTLTWDPRIAGGAPTVRLDPRYGRVTYTADTSRPGRLVVDFKSPNASFNSVPGTIIDISMPISASASIGATSPFKLDPAGTWFLNGKGKKIKVALQNGTIAVQ